MAEVDEECTFYTGTDQVRFITQTNGDAIYMKNLKLTRAQATSLAWLINTDDTVELEFQVKIKGT